MFPQMGEVDRLISHSFFAHQSCQSYLHLPGLVCANALPATDFEVLLNLPSRRTLLAFEATALDVCFEFLAIANHLAFYIRFAFFDCLCEYFFAFA